MGNCYAVHFLITNPTSCSDIKLHDQNTRKENYSCSRELFKRYNQEKEEKVVKIVKNDGKILEYSKPVLAKDVLMNFPGYRIVLLSKTSKNYFLPENHRLMVGNVYHLVPTLNSSVRRSSNSAVPKISPVDTNKGYEKIKVVVTRKQLRRQLLVENMSVDEMSSLLGVNKRVLCKKLVSCCRTSTRHKWKPVLQTIHEEDE